MTCLLLSFFILSADASAQTDLGPQEVVEVYRCDFEPQADANYDLWPDDWTRRRGRGYPRYLKIEIADDPQPAAEGNRCLRMQLDGGAALAYSPLIEVSPLFSYELHVRLKTAGLTHHRAVVELIFYDQERRVVESLRSRPLRHVPRWTDVPLGPVTPADERVRWAAVALHLQPTEQADLRGEALFDDVRLGRLPRMSLETPDPHNIYTRAGDVRVTCRLSGYTDPHPQLRCELLDAYGRLLHVDQLTLDDDALPAPAVPVRPAAAGRETPGLSGSATWQPPIQDNGFYQVRVSVPGHPGLTRSLNLVVVAGEPPPADGEYGWTLPRGDEPLALKTLTRLLGHVGINWVKFPVWYGDSARAEELAWFTERLSVNNIQLVGMLDQPPPNTRQLFFEQGRLPVASVFLEPEVWHPAVDPVLTRLSLKVRWWQLGDDGDTSFINFPNLEEKLNEIRAGFNRFGQETNLGITWRSIDEAPFSAQPPLAFLSYIADPPLSADELQNYLAAAAGSPIRRWVVLRPLPREQYDLDTRARDLVERMLAAKMAGSRGIFVPDPFSHDHGLMEEDGAPGPLLLPWRTTALMVSGAKYLGSINLPGGSTNHIFVRGDQAVMAVWNDRPTRETIYLGEDVAQFDLWGRRQTPGRKLDDDGFARQQIEVGPLPTFITGVNPTLTRWRMSLEFETQQLASIFGRQQRAVYHFRNTFPHGVGGSVTLHPPPVWQVDAARAQFKLSAGELRRQALYVLLGTNADSGPQPLRLDFHVAADRNYRFSVYHTIQVGLGDIEVDLETHLDEQGNLVVEQHLTNRSEQFVSFHCLLFAPGRRRERRQVFNLGRGRRTNTFVLPDGQQLIGATLTLRAEEIGGARILNHHVVAEE